MTNIKPTITIAIDGYSSSGKSSMAKVLAKKIGYRYIDSGAMYRAVTLYAMRNNMISPDHVVDCDALISALPLINIDFKVCDDGQHTMLNGEDIENQIRQLDVSNNVSQVAVIPAIRHALVAMQQAFGKEKGIVMDGRDIGTVVLPDAEVKIYLDAGVEERARRRVGELEAKGETADFEEIKKMIIQRDYNDMNREHSPLKRADDAISLDSTSMTVEEVEQAILDIVAERVKN